MCLDVGAKWSGDEMRDDSIPLGDGYWDGLLDDRRGGGGASGDDLGGEVADPAGAVDSGEAGAAVAGAKKRAAGSSGRVARIADRQPEDVEERANKEARRAAVRKAADAAGFRWVNFPIVRETGAVVKSHIENTRALMEAYEVRVRYNEMSHELEYTIPGLRSDRKNMVARDWLAARAEHHGLAVEPLDRHVTLIADSYHPMREWIVSRPWDGQDRIDDLLDTLTLAKRSTPEADAGARKLAKIYLERWLVTLARFLEPGAYAKRISAQGVLVLLGEGNARKTEWIKTLVPPDWQLTGLQLDVHDRDSVQQATSKVLCELGELDGTFARREGTMSALKAFVTRPDDTYRSSYARREETFPRRTIFAGSVNRRVFLDDDTGNRRWWVVEVTAVDREHKTDMQQVWAQAASMAAAGHPYWLSDEEVAACNTENEAYQPVDFLEEEIRAAFEPDPFGGFMTYPEIAKELSRFQNRAPTKVESAKIGEILHKMGCGRHNNGSARGRKCRRRLVPK